VRSWKGEVRIIDDMSPGSRLFRAAEEGGGRMADVGRR
jgi:hypothetical protein